MSSVILPNRLSPPARTLTVHRVEGPELYRAGGPSGAPASTCVILDVPHRVLRAGFSPLEDPALAPWQESRHIQVWGIGPLRDVAANALLDEVAGDAVILCDEAFEEWHCGARVAGYTDLGRSASERIRRACARTADRPEDHLVVWPAARWLSTFGRPEDQRAVLGISSGTSYEALHDLELTLLEQAHAQGADVVPGLLRHLTYLRDKEYQNK